MTEVEFQHYISVVAQDVEKTLANMHGIHLKTDDFNTLYDFISSILERIRETGE